MITLAATLVLFTGAVSAHEGKKCCAKGKSCCKKEASKKYVSKKDNTANAEKKS